jgi:DNA-binding NtrC family response regulator
MKRAYRGVDSATLKLLMSQPWKGNVRELDNVIEHAMILGNGEWITVADLPRPLRESDDVLPQSATSCARRSAQYERITSRPCCGARSRQAEGRPSCSASRCPRSTGR